MAQDEVTFYLVVATSFMVTALCFFVLATY